MKILLVEDDRKLAMAMSIRLKASGFSYVVSGDAISAVSQAVREKPDLAIIDINLPGGDGFVVAERLLSLGETSHVPFVFITASKQEGLRERARSLGALGFLEKPFDAMKLINLLDEQVMH